MANFKSFYGLSKPRRGYTSQVAKSSSILNLVNHATAANHPNPVSSDHTGRLRIKYWPIFRFYSHIKLTLIFFFENLSSSD